MTTTYREQPKEYRPVGASRVTLYVVSTLSLCVIAVAAVITITVIRPEADNSGLITTVLGILTPVVGALLAGALKEVHTDVNSRLTEFLALTEKAAKAEGQLLGSTTTAPGVQALPAIPAATAGGIPISLPVTIVAADPGAVVPVKVIPEHKEPV